VLDNAQFVGELVGRLEERGIHVVQLTKLEILRALGIKGKAPATRVRKVVTTLFGDLGKTTDHEVDAVAAAFVGRMKFKQGAKGGAL
jgi:Holliday junction resolvasome RuvABC endonuclease subunit